MSRIVATLAHSVLSSSLMHAILSDNATLLNFCFGSLEADNPLVHLHCGEVDLTSDNLVRVASIKNEPTNETSVVSVSSLVPSAQLVLDVEVLQRVQDIVHVVC